MVKLVLGMAVICFYTSVGAYQKGMVMGINETNIRIIDKRNYEYMFLKERCFYDGPLEISIRKRTQKEQDSYKDGYTAGKADYPEKKKSIFKGAWE